jgi:hypothetical protein
VEGKKHLSETKEMVPQAVSNKEDNEKENGFFAPDVNSFGN